MLEHKNLINLIDYQYRCTAIDFNRVLQYAPIGFDVSFQEIFSTLLAGGRLYMLEKEIRADLDKLVHMIRKHEIKTLFFPAALVKVLSTLTNTMEPIPGCVEHLVAAGEQLVVPQEFARCLESRLVSLHNHYGPSETHVVTTFTMAPEADKPRLPAIGRPIANSALFIVDAGGRLQPEGAQGEICIAGRQVGRGYLNNPEMTAERFITAPAFSQQPWVGAQNVVPLQSSMTEPGRPHGVAPTNCKLTTDNCKLYKTGDLGRYLSDGNIGFLGRVDHQVKIRGFRVEPGEIESQLLNHPDIIEAAVMLRADNRSEPYLCAYIVDVVGAAPRGRPGNKAISKEGTEALREFLSRSLPDYMIPARFVRLEKIPLSPNGKVDRRALPEPGVEAGPEYVAPGNETEEALAEIWSQVLGIETDRIGMESNFFDLGGHSLRATVMAAKLQKEFGIDVSLAEIFRKPTIRGIATMIQTINWVKNQELLGGDEIDEFVL